MNAEGGTLVVESTAQAGGPASEGDEPQAPQPGLPELEPLVDPAELAGEQDELPVPATESASAEVQAESPEAQAGSTSAQAETNGAEPRLGNELGDEALLACVSSLVFASPDPLSEKRIAALLDDPDLPRVRLALESLRAKLAASGLPLELRQLAGGWTILTAAHMGPTVQRLFKARKAERISPAALETLAVVAYRQPVTKAEIEAIRGVQSAPILRTLIDRGLVRVSGRADQPGHPLQYGTTREFLDRFGLADLGELPRDSELAKD